ncbi:GtrA family protein [Mariniluteicoccus flavus]
MRAIWEPLRFFLVGTVGTAAYAGLYLVLGLRLPDTVALTAAWLLSTLATNLAHRHITFGIHDPRGRGRDAAVFFATSLLGLGATQVTFAVTRGLSPAAEVAAIVAGTGAAGVVRYLVMRGWVGLRLAGARSANVGEGGARSGDVQSRQATCARSAV